MTGKSLFVGSFLGTVILLAGCTDMNDKSLNYFSYSSTECKQIAYTCAQDEVSFSNAVGCGCRVTGKVSSTEGERSLVSLVNRYMKENVLKTLNNGMIFNMHTRIGAEEKDNILVYDAYGSIDEFFMKDKKIYYGARQTGIFQFKIEETNRNYIIRDYTFFDPDNLKESDIKFLAGETQKWLQDKKAVEDMKRVIIGKIKFMAANAFGRTMEDFEDYIAPSTQESSQQTGTQQSTQQN